MYFLPDEIIITIGLLLPIKDNSILSQTNSRFNNIICNSETFWKRKFSFDYGESRQKGSWKLAYYNYGQITVFGYPLFYPNGINPPNFYNDYKSITQIPKIRAKKVYCDSSSIMIIDINENIKSLGSGGMHGAKYVFIPNSLFNSPAKDISEENNYRVMIDINNDVWLSGHIKLGKRTNQYSPIKTTIKIPDIKARSISSGFRHTLILDINNNVWSFGDNFYGQLGLNDKNDRYEPTQIPGIQAKYITCGTETTFIIDINDNILGFGRNFGNLGLGDVQERLTPVRIPDIKGKSVSCSIDHTIIIDMDNNIWGTGDNSAGQLGLGDKEHRRFFTQIPNIKTKAVSSCDYHTMLIDMDDNVWGFGSNSNSQLGLGDRIHRLIPTQVPYIKARSVSCSKLHSVVLL